MGERKGEEKKDRKLISKSLLAFCELHTIFKNLQRLLLK